MSEIRSIISKINALMHEKEMTQQDLCRATGIIHSQMNRYLNNHNEPSLEKIFLIAKALGVSVSDLISDKTPEFAPPRKPSENEMAAFILERMSLDARALAIIAFVLAASETELRVLDRYVKSMAELAEERANPGKSVKAPKSVG